MIVSIDKTHELKGNGYLLGVDGENGSEQLIIKVENEKLLDKWAYIEFEKDNGEKFTTERLSVVGGQIVYDIVNGLLPQGHVKVQVIFRDADGFVWKTFVRRFAVDKSLNACCNLPIEHPDFIGEAQKLLDEISVESERVDEVLESEEARKTAETARKTAETERTENETARAEAEESRANAEAERASSEESRKTNETAREKAETARRTEFAGWSKNLGNLNTYDKRLINLEEAGVGVLFDYQKDNSTAYRKAVPERTLPYAILNKVSGATSIKCIGKNKFNLDLSIYETRGLTLQKGGNSSYIINGTATETVDIYIGAENGSYFNKNDKELIAEVNSENSTYTITNNGGFTSYALIGGAYQKTTFGITDGNKATALFVRIPSGRTFEDYELKIMLNRGSATDYEEYKENTYALPLTDGYIKVEPNGSVVFENDNGQAVPSEITFFVKK